MHSQLPSSSYSALEMAHCLGSSEGVFEAELRSAEYCFTFLTDLKLFISPSPCLLPLIKNEASGSLGIPMHISETNKPGHADSVGTEIQPQEATSPTDELSLIQNVPRFTVLKLDYFSFIFLFNL